MVTLTPQQEKFAQAIASGKSQADAYRIAYKCANSKPNTIHRKASALMSEDKISARVAELKAQLSEKALWTREDSVRTLLSNMADPDAKPSDKNQTVKILNEMHGYNAPVKIEHSGAIETVTRRVVDPKGDK